MSIGQSVDEMPEENNGHTCIYVVDDGDRNFKYCVYCLRVRYRTDAELMEDYATRLERKLRGV